MTNNSPSSEDVPLPSPLAGQNLPPPQEDHNLLEEPCGVEVEAVSAAAEMEERAKAWFGEAPAAEVEEPEVPQICEHAMMHICPLCPFGTGETRVLSWQGQSSPQSRVMLFVKAGTCVDYSERNASIKLARSHLPRRCGNPYRAIEDGPRGMTVPPVAC